MVKAVLKLAGGGCLAEAAGKLYIAGDGGAVEEAPLQNLESWMRPGMVSEMTAGEKARAEKALQEHLKRQGPEAFVCSRCVWKTEKIDRCRVFTEKKPLDFLYEEGLCPWFLEEDRKDSRRDGGPGSGNFNHRGRKGMVGGSVTAGTTGAAAAEQKPEPPRESRAKKDWREKTEKERDELLSKRANVQALEMNRRGFLSRDDAVAQMKDGTVSESVRRYYEILAENGDPSPKGETVTKQKSVRPAPGEDWEEARLAEVKKDTGLPDAEAEKCFDALKQWTRGAMLSPEEEQALNLYAEKAPVYAGTIYRGMSFSSPEEYDALMEQFRSGQVRMRGPSSWSSDPDVARMFAHTVDDDAESVVVRCVASRTGVPIRHLSQHSQEDEVLSPGGAQWTVLSIEQGESHTGCRKAVITVIERGAEDG